MAANQWPNGAVVAQVRIARPTSQLEAIIRFYGEGLGLARVASFENHNGYSGAMFGLPGKNYHLEFTQHESGNSCPAPTKDNLLVFYFPSEIDLKSVMARLARLGCVAVLSENPYWSEKGVTFEDPDGWRIVLMNSNGI